MGNTGMHGDAKGCIGMHSIGTQGRMPGAMLTECDEIIFGNTLCKLINMIGLSNTSIQT